MNALITTLALVFLGLNAGANCNPKFSHLSGTTSGDVTPAQRFAEQSPKAVTDLTRAVEIFKNPAKYLDPKDTAADTTAFEDRMIANYALEFLARKGADTANATHIQEHLDLLENPEVVAALEKAGISILGAVRNVLIHDLGKEFDQLPEQYQALLKEIYPVVMENGFDTNAFAREIGAHGLSSMVAVQEMGEALGLSQAKINRLNAKHAHHNAGYDPKLKGFHFWVAIGWGKTAGKLKKFGFDIPQTYAPILATNKGGDPETVILTAPDRLVSQTLSSQEKFSDFLVGIGLWNNAGLADQFMGNATGPTAEGGNVLKNLVATSPSQKLAYGEVKKAILKHFQPRSAELRVLASKLGEMAKGKGEYAGRPETTADELANSVIYRNSQNEWFRVVGNGEFYRAVDGGKWELDVKNTKVGATAKEATRSFYRLVLFPDVNFQPPALKSPSILRQSLFGSN